MDKTGLSEVYDYEFYLPLPQAGQRGNGPGQIAGPPTPAEVFAWRAPAIATALEKQLGLRLQAEKVRAEVIVVDQVEKPTPN